MNFLRFGCLCLSLVLTACGGGGGGSKDENNGGGGIRFAADRTSLTFEYIEGNFPAAQTVIVTATGNYSGTLYLGATANGVGIDPNITLAILSDTQGQFTINAAPGLAVGTYTGNIQLLACSDANCNRQVGNSPLNISYTLNVRTRLHVTPDSINLGAVSGNSATADVNVTLPWNVASFTATPSDNWLTVSSPNNTTLRITARSRPSGTYGGSVLVTSGPYQQQVIVNYAVTAPPGGEHDLQANPTSLSLNAVEGTTSNPSMLNIIGPTWDSTMVTSYQVFPTDGYPANWLELTPVAGGYSLVGNAATTGWGTYHAEILINGSMESPWTQLRIPVTFTVGQGLIQPAEVNVTIDATTTTTSPNLVGSVPINVMTGGQIDWTASSDQPWLILTRASGATGSALEYRVDPYSYAMNVDMYGDQTATVTVAPSLPNMRPITFRVNVHKRLAKLRAVTPWMQYTGRSSRHVLRGVGFVAARDWSQYLLINGVPAGDRVTRVNDTEMVLNLQPLAETYIWIEARNELHNYNDGPHMVTNAARVFPYSVIPTGHRIKTLQFRDVFNQVHVVDEEGGRIVTHIYSIGSWLQAVTNMPGVKDISPMLDGNGLFAIGTQGFAELDNSLQTYPPQPLWPGMTASDYNSAIIQTNDRRVWFAVQTPTGYSLAYRDYPSGDRFLVDTPLLQAQQIPWFARSGDGERVFISQDRNGSQSRTPLVFNSADNVMSAVPDYGVIENWLDGASVSEDGSRLVTESWRIRNAQFMPIGHVGVAHDDYITVSAVVSPDARRAYVLAYEGYEITRPAPLFTPRVYVFDITSPQGPDVRMPMLGYFSVPDYPTCLSQTGCFAYPKGAISGDGGTLAFAGDQSILVIPIPAEHTLNSGAPPPRLRKQALRTTPWHVDTH